LDFGKTYYATLYTLKSNIWLSTSSTFNTLDQPSTPNVDQLRSTFYSNVQQATAAVRMMQDPTTGALVSGSPLEVLVKQRGATGASCVLFALVLQDQLQQVGILARIRNITLTGDTYEAHTMTEYYDPFLQKWSVADATFGIIYFDPATQTGQSVEEIQSLVVGNSFTNIHIQPVTSFGDGLLRSYYMDPLTLYLNVLSLVPGQPIMQHSPLQFLQAIPLENAAGAAGVYVFEFAATSDQLQATILGNPVTLTPVDGTLFSKAFGAPDGWTLDLAPPGLKAYTFVRPVF
jgi:hypothetical protein